MLKTDQPYSENFVEFTTEEFKSMFDRFSTFFMEGFNGHSACDNLTKKEAAIKSLLAIPKKVRNNQLCKKK